MIEAIYEAASDDEAYAALPGLLAEAVGARSATFLNIEDGAPVHVAASYFTSEMSDYYVSAGIDRHDVWNTLVMERGLTNRAVTSDRIMTREAFAGSVFYNEFFRRFGDDTGVSLGSVISTKRGFIGLGLHRPISAQSYDEADIAHLDAAIPHLRRMAAIRARLALAQRRTDELQGLLDAQTHGLILTDGAGRVKFANEVAETILKVGDRLRIRNGRLTAVDPGCHAGLEAALSSAATDTGARGGAVWATGASGRVCRLSVSPHRSSAGSAGVLILLDEGAPPADDSRQALRSLYGLTVAEADLAQHLFQGLTLQQAADQRGVSLTTVQTQLKAIRDRTGARRQSDLTTLISGLARLSPRRR